MVNAGISISDEGLFSVTAVDIYMLPSPMLH
jgi:hypothetical protein